MNEFFMKEALEEAKIAYSKNEVPIGCVIVKDGKIIGRGHNQKEEKNSAIFHAEIVAILEASKYLNNWWLEDCEVYVTLEPCAMCAGALLNSRIKKLYVGTKDYRMGSCGTSIDLTNVEGFNHSFQVEFGILANECSQIISKFFKNLRNKKTCVLC